MAVERKEVRPSVGPVIIAAAPTKPERSGETVARLAYGVGSALVVSLVWILGSPADLHTKAWSVVIGLSAAALVLAGHATWEVSRMRGELTACETQVQAALAALATDLAEHTRDKTQDERRGRGPGGDGRRGRRRPARRRGQPEPNAGEIISDEFRVYLQGRESRFDDGSGTLL